MVSKNKNIQNKNLFKKIKSNYFLKLIFDHLSQKKSFKIPQYNKNIQKCLNIGLNDYKTFYEKIEIDLEVSENSPLVNYFIKFPKKYNNRFHIYFNDDYENEMKKNFVNFNKEKVKKVKIIIDNEIKSFSKLFEECICIEKINFIKFNRKDITDMSSMFDGCSSLKEINFNNNFHTDKVTNMSRMFFECSSLKKLNLNNFNTKNVIYMEGMFEGCTSLKELNLASFNTNKVTSMFRMFYNCSSLIKLNLNNFNIDNVNDISWMFYNCSSMKELNIDNFNLDNIREMIGVFSKCNDELRKKMKEKFNYLKYEAFHNI